MGKVLFVLKIGFVIAWVVLGGIYLLNAIRAGKKSDRFETGLCLLFSFVQLGAAYILGTYFI